jgi:monothiol glutaredoxin
MSDMEEIKKQIGEAVASYPVLLFMKGTPTFPQCGFSQRVVQILGDYGVEYRAVDVLSNPLVREGVKEFSDWPTIPQLYVKGELVGGCDIVAELHESGELADVLQGGEPASAPDG